MTLRSWLFTPGNSRKMIEKAAASSADCIIIDLEDAVAPSEKEQARTTTTTALGEVDFGGKSVLVRINGLDTPFATDDVEATRLLAGGFVVPKVDHAQTLHTMAELPVDEVPVYALIESAAGVLNLPQIVAVREPPVGLTGLIFGGEDFVASVGAQATAGRQEILYARSAVVTAAAAVGIVAIDTVYTDFRNLEGLRDDAQTAKQLGFSGKLAIHPKQADVINEVWLPTSAEIATARQLVTAFNRHRQEGTGVFEHNGRMVDLAVIRNARRILESEPDSEK